MTFIIDPPLQPSVPIVGTDKRFAVRRIFCVGRNYAQHVREMGNDPKSEPPVFFTKPADAVVETGATIPYPSVTSNFHHEVELVVALQQGGAGIAESAALDCVWGYAVGVDLTRRDRQAEAKQAGNPWDPAKGFDNSAPVGALTPASVIGHPISGAIRLRVNDALRQNGDIADMIWRVPEIIAALSHIWELKAGDLVFTGTPHGVGPLEPGDAIVAEIDGLSPLTLSIAQR